MLTFLGATGTVTGSRFVVDTAQSTVMVDAGLHQGFKELRRRNWDPFPRDPSMVAALVLTHAHLDHVGHLPRLVRDGFTGPVVCTEETAELAAIVLRDSAHLQEEDAAYANEAGFSAHTPGLPLYDASDVERTLELVRAVPVHDRVPLEDEVWVTLRPAGHILGSATALVEAGGTRTLFSGDLGRPHHPVVPDREDLRRRTRSSWRRPTATGCTSQVGRTGSPRLSVAPSAAGGACSSPPSPWTAPRSCSSGWVG
jgi:metallo-beta-lactamase family protein